MYFSYNGTRDWLKIEWRDQSCMKLEVVTENKHNEIKYALDLRETGLYKQVSFAQIHFLLFLRDKSPGYAISL